MVSFDPVVRYNSAMLDLSRFSPLALTTSPVLPVSGKKVIARAYVLRAGRTLFVSRIDLFDARKNLGAVAVVTYMLFNAK